MIASDSITVINFYLDSLIEECLVKINRVDSFSNNQAGHMHSVLHSKLMQVEELKKITELKEDINSCYLPRQSEFITDCDFPVNDYWVTT